MTYIKYIPAGLLWYSISTATPIRTEMIQKREITTMNNAIFLVWFCVFFPSFSTTWLFYAFFSSRSLFSVRYIVLKCKLCDDCACTQKTDAIKKVRQLYNGLQTVDLIMSYQNCWLI